jgi:hypothetical protein
MRGQDLHFRSHGHHPLSSRLKSNHQPGNLQTHPRFGQVLASKPR